MAGEHPTDPHLFDEWAVLIRPAEADLDPGLTDRIRVAIDELPVRQRDVINGVFYEACTKTEIARRMGVSRHEVRNLYLEALKALTEVLA